MKYKRRQILLFPISVLAFVIRNPSSQSGTGIGSNPPEDNFI